MQRSRRSTGQDLDLELIGRLIDQARRGLDRLSSIKRAHTAAVRKIDEAGGHLAELHAEVALALDRIEAALSPARADRTA
ncbi:hypothetical protein [Geodermatophilus sp. URMC 63]